MRRAEEYKDSADNAVGATAEEPDWRGATGGRFWHSPELEQELRRLAQLTGRMGQAVMRDLQQAARGGQLEVISAQ
ncbi:MAG TPA: hypothetical protein VNQ79_05410 [Blastocatellia bacterium]|nr:hypothetical protein [Blastocatellia bacterium]